MVNIKRDLSEKAGITSNVLRKIRSARRRGWQKVSSLLSSLTVRYFEDETNQSFAGSGLRCCPSIYTEPLGVFTATPASMAANFTKNAEESPEACKAEVKGTKSGF